MATETVGTEAAEPEVEKTPKVKAPSGKQIQDSARDLFTKSGAHNTFVHMVERGGKGTGKSRLYQAWCKTENIAVGDPTTGIQACKDQLDHAQATVGSEPEAAPKPEEELEELAAASDPSTSEAEA